MIIAVDFDGTVVTHEYPNVGRFIGAQKVLNKLIENRHQLILWTMRSGNELEEAVDWFRNNNIELWGINNNPDQHKWTESRKAYAHMYIDDAALGIPLCEGLQGERPFVYWDKVEQMLISMGVIVG